MANTILVVGYGPGISNAVAEVKGTAWDRGQATLDASAIANRFFELHTTRTEPSVRFPA